MTDEMAEKLKAVAFHMRALADAIDAMCEHNSGNCVAMPTHNNPTLDDVVLWGSYHKRRLAVLPVRFRRLVEAEARAKRLEVDARDYDVSTFRKLLKHGRRRLLQTSNIGETTIKTLDDEFAARNCPEWLSS